MTTRRDSGRACFPTWTVRDDLVINEGRHNRLGHAQELCRISTSWSKNSCGSMAREPWLAMTRLIATCRTRQKYVVQIQLRRYDRYPNLVQLFQHYGQDTFNFDWLMLVAQAYQESGLQAESKKRCWRNRHNANQALNCGGQEILAS